MIIEENTIDFTAHIYDSPHFDAYRTTLKPSPDFPGVVVLCHEEFDDIKRDYVVKGEVSFDKTQWHKISYAVEVLFDKTV